MRLFWLLLLIPVLHRPSDPPTLALEKPRNVILLIGDGMGLSQITAAFIANKDQLSMLRMPHTGLISTFSAKEKVTDSAASATAMACGCKTQNGMLGMNARKKDCENLFEQAKARNLATGIVVTSSVVHATPAAFVAHVQRREYKEKIALAFLDSGIDILIGGGRKYFNRRTDDRRNLETELLQKGYRVENMDETPFKKVAFDSTEPLIYFVHDDEPPPVYEGRAFLPDATAEACRFLDKRSENGFFLMVEGSQIDWAAHKNKADWMIAETLDFDQAVGEALRFAEADGRTLVIVTADHETGGAAIVQGSTPDSLRIEFVGQQHTAVMVPVFAYGPGAELFEGVYDNTDIYFKIKLALGW